MADDLNRRIAELRGWTNLTQIDNHWSGTPPDYAPEERRLIPNWLKDWTATGPLLDNLLVACDSMDERRAFADLVLYRIGPNCIIEPRDTAYRLGIRELIKSGDTLQRAICEAWVAWKTAGEAQK